MNFRTVLGIYNLLMPLGFLAAIPGYLVKMVRRGNYGKDFRQRFGMFSPSARKRLPDDKPIWVHAVSVGEVLVAIKFIRALRAQAPRIPVVLSCTTSTAFQLAQGQREDLFLAIYNPLDFKWIVRRTLAMIRPRVLVLVEAELWPNLLSEAKREGIPAALINARLSPRSERRYGQFRLITAPIFGQLDLVLVQTPEDSGRWARLGVRRDKIFCHGSIKYDQENQPAPEAQMMQFSLILNNLRGSDKGPVILAGSTHPGEEALIGKVIRELQESYPDLFYIAVPRHFERRETVISELRSLGFDPVLKTSWDKFDPHTAASQPCLVVDTTGELWAWYHLADIVVIGKTLLAEEGQNPVEPVLAGKPVVMGPEMRNFESLARRLIDAGGCVRLSRVEDLGEQLAQLLGDAERCAELARRGVEVVGQDQGAARRSAEAVLEFVKLA